MKFYFTLFAFLGCFIQSYAQTPGTIDVSFGTNGYKNMGIPMGDLAELPNKNLLANTSEGITIFKAPDYSLLDSSFADSGYIKPFGGFQIRYSGLLPDGRIMAVFLKNGVIKIARYSATGVLDMSYGIGGFSDSITSTISFTAFDFLVHPNGSVFLTGLSGSPVGSLDGDIFMIHINPNGQKTYPGTGILNLDLWGTGYDVGIGLALALQPDGKVLMGGQIYPAGTGSFAESVMYMRRFNEDGQADNSFNNIGYLKDNDGDWSGIEDIVVAPNGKIYVTASRGYDSNMVIRYNANGTRDNSFGTQGIHVQYGISSHNILLQPDGKILVNAQTDNFNSPDPLIVRLRTNGTYDSAFGPGGSYVQPYDPSLQNFMQEMILLSSGKILFSVYAIALDNASILSRLHTGLVVAAEEPFAPSVKVASIHPNVIRERVPLRVSYSPTGDIDPAAIVVSANGTTVATTIKSVSGDYWEADMPTNLAPGIYQLLFMDGNDAVRAQFVKVD